MKNLLLLGLIVFGGMQVWEKIGGHEQPIYDEPYIAVYGRNSCGFTKNMISSLKASGVNYHYFIVDDQDVANSLHSRMNLSGISTKRYNLPVVDTNGLLQVRPKFQDVLAKYNAGL